MKRVSSFTDVKPYDVKQDNLLPPDFPNRRQECQVPYLALACIVTSSVYLFLGVAVGVPPLRRSISQ